MIHRNMCCTFRTLPKRTTSSRGSSGLQRAQLALYNGEDDQHADGEVKIVQSALCCKIVSRRTVLCDSGTLKGFLVQGC
jgi:hypothetical protein